MVVAIDHLDDTERAQARRQPVTKPRMLVGRDARCDLVLGDATRTKLTWATEALACSAFLERDDGCFRSRLDHVLAFRPPTTVRALVACATDGCARQDRCPRYIEQVSDHCPVVVTF